MAKICTICGYAPEKDAEQRPSEPIEDCPQCGGIETVQSNEAQLGEEPEEE